MLICYHPYIHHNWKICIPTAELQSILQWYHEVLNHVGADNLYQTVQAHFTFPGRLKEAAADYDKHCGTCQQHKLPGRGYGHLPPREAQVQPFYNCCINLIGPWNINLNGEVSSFNALTCIDSVTSLTELIRLQNKSSDHAAFKLKQAWLMRYPRPVQCIHDHGTEFTGAPFQQLLESLGIKDVPTLVANPQANTICERMHQIVGNLLRTLLYSTPPNQLQQVENMIDYTLATAQHSL